MRRFICDFCGKETKPFGWFSFRNGNGDGFKDPQKDVYVEYCEACAPGATGRVKSALKEAKIGFTDPVEPPTPSS